MNKMKSVSKNEGFFISIKYQLLITMILITLFLTISIIFSVRYIVSNIYNEKIDKENETLTTLISNNLSAFVDKAYRITEELSVDPRILSMDTETQHELLYACNQRNDYFELLYVQDMAGMQTGKSEGELLDRSGRDWYKKMIAEMKPFVYKPFFSGTSHKPVTTVFMPLYRGKEAVGIIGANIKLDYLQELIQQYADETEGRYCYIMDNSGGIIAHPDTELITQLYNYKTLTKTVESKDSAGNIIFGDDELPKTEEQPIELADGYIEITEQAIAGNSGSLRFEDEGIGYCASYAPIHLPGESEEWSIITVQNEGNAKSIITQIVKTSLLACLCVLVVSILFIFIFSRKISRPIIKISRLLTGASNGDFSGMSNVRARSEIGTLSDSFNEMVEKVSFLIKNTQDLTKNIAGSSAILNEQAGKTQKVAQNINMSVGRIAGGASKQASDSELSAGLGLNMAGKFRDLKDKSDLMLSKADMSVRVTEEGTIKVVELKDKTAKTVELMNLAEESVKKLSQKSNSIETILDTLNDIASETKLLSLNASIEAARAGVQGRSFTIVAEEIQKLSVESEASTQNIAAIISDIQNEIRISVEMINNVKIVSSEEMVSVDNVNKAFEKIMEAIGNIKEIIKDIGCFVKDMDNDNENIVTTINNNAAISVETAAYSKEVTASLLEQTKSIEEVAKQSHDLQEKAALLEGEINKFRIEQ